MFGRELARGNINIKGRIFYWLFGLDNLGQRIRAFHVFKMLDLLSGYPKRILDAGSGYGSFCFALSRRYTRAHITGIELDPVAVQDSRYVLAQLNYENATIKQGDISSDNREGLFDLIICMDVLEHIPDDVSALRYLYISLAKGGVLLLHVPQRHQLTRTIFGNTSQKKRQFDHVRDEYTEEEITNKIAAQGFIIRKKRYTFGFAGALARELMDKMEKVRFFGPFLKLTTFPLVLSISRLDIFANNINYHQGFLFELVKA